MKKLFISLLLASGALLPYNAAAQVNLNINIGSQPLWGPTGYDHVDYYYLPDIESYYYVPTREFIYPNNGKWIYSSGLPASYRNYNLYNGYKVVINSPKPFLNFKEQKIKYSKYKSNHSQTVIVRSNNPKYYVINGHPKHGAKVHFKGSAGNYKAKGNGQPHSKGRGNGKH